MPLLVLYDVLIEWQLSVCPPSPTPACSPHITDCTAQPAMLYANAIP